MFKRSGSMAARDPTEALKKRIGTVKFSVWSPLPLFLVVVATTCCVHDAAQPYAAITRPKQQSAITVDQAMPMPNDVGLPDPLALLGEARAKYQADDRDYECTFWRQDRLAGRLHARQQIEVLYRREPRTILMKWVKNAGQVRRALYVAGRDFNDQGQECAMIEPANPIFRLCVSKVAIPIHGRRAKKSSRYPLDAFGFGATLDRIERVNAMAAARGELDLRYVGEGEVDGRPTHIIERRLPETGANSRYPDAKLVVQLDQEWLVPVSIQSFADQKGMQLLGSYVMTNVKFLHKIDVERLRF